MLPPERPSTSRPAKSIGTLRASASITKLTAVPTRLRMSTGRRPQRSDSAPSAGDAISWHSEKVAITSPITCSDAPNDRAYSGSNGIMIPNPMRLTTRVRTMTRSRRSTGARGERAGAARGAAGSAFPASHDERRVGPAEAERVRDRRPYVGPARLVRHVVEVALGVGIVEIDRRSDDARLERLRHDQRLERAGRSDQVPGHRLRRAHRDPEGVIAQRELDALGLVDVAEGRG